MSDNPAALGATGGTAVALTPPMLKICGKPVLAIINRLL